DEALAKLGCSGQRALEPGDGAREVAVVRASLRIVKDEAAHLSGVLRDEIVLVVPAVAPKLAETERGRVRPGVPPLIGARILERNPRLLSIDVALQSGEGELLVERQRLHLDRIERGGGRGESRQRLPLGPGDAFLDRLDRRIGERSIRPARDLLGPGDSCEENERDDPQRTAPAIRSSDARVPIQSPEVRDQHLIVFRFLPTRPIFSIFSMSESACGTLQAVSPISTSTVPMARAARFASARSGLTYAPTE